MGDRTVFMTGSGRGSELRWRRVPQSGKSASLRAAYQRYREREAQAFLRMIPRAGIRPLYAEARAWAARTGVHEGKDPMASLVAFCKERLPLPPFGVWLEDVRAHPGSHAQATSEHTLSEEDRVPNEVAVRRLEYAGRPWTAGLNVFHQGGNWRGFISFQSADATGPGASVRTSTVFCEPQLDTVTRVFQDFTSTTLSGFLRSVLP